MEVRCLLPMVFPYHSFSQQPTSSNSFSLPDVMTYHSKMLWRDSWRSDFTTTISLEEYSSVHELPCLGTLWFRLILEGLFACIASPNNWGKTGVEFLTLTSLKRSGKTTNLAILITDRAGGRCGLSVSFLSPWSSQDRGLWCPLHPTPMWLIRAENGGGDMIL